MSLRFVGTAVATLTLFCAACGENAEQSKAAVPDSAAHEPLKMCGKPNPTSINLTCVAKTAVLQVSASGDALAPELTVQNAAGKSVFSKPFAEVANCAYVVGWTAPDADEYTYTVRRFNRGISSISSWSQVGVISADPCS